MLGLFLKRAKILGTLGLIFFSIYSLGLAGIVGFLFSDAFVLSLLDEAKVSELTNSTTGLAIFASIILYVFGLVSFGVYSAIKKAYPKAPILIYSLGSLITPFAMVLPYIVVNLVETAASASVVYLGFWLWKNIKTDNQ
jgi:hypothetical protein